MKKITLLLLSLFIFSYAVPVFAAPLTGADADLSYYYFDGTVDTTDANDAGGDGDVEWPGSGGAGPVYIIAAEKFSQVFFDINATAYGAGGGASPMTVRYYNGVDFSSTVEPSGNPFGATGIQSFSFTVPGDWEMTSLDGEGPGYYIQIEANGIQGFNVVNQISVLTSGAAAPVPEFSTMLFFVTMLMAGTFIIAKNRQVDASATLRI